MSTKTIDSIVVGRTLGSGFSAKVKEGFQPDGSKVALKIFYKDAANFNQDLLKLCKTEIDKTSKLNHPSLVKHFAFKEDAVFTHKDGR